MAATNFTPISLYYSATAASVPTAGNLVAGELALNTADGKLFYKDSAGVVQTLASKSTTSGVFTSVTDSGLTSGRVTYATTGGLLTDNVNFVFDGTNLGIGTNNPSSWGKLAVYGTSSGGQVVSAIVNSSGTANTQAVLSFDTSASGFNVRDSQIRATNNGSNQTTLQFYTSNATTPAEAMRITSSGTVGIGTTSPTGQLDVVSGNSLVGRFYNNAGRGIVRVDGSSDSSFQVYRNGSIIGWFQSDSSGTEVNMGTSGAYPLAFYTNNTERMRITSAGGVSFGATGAAYGTSGQVLTSAGNAPPTWTTIGGSTPTWNQVGSYMNGVVNGQATAGSNYSAGSGTNQARGFNSYGDSTSVSGTWQWMSATATVSSNNNGGVMLRIA